MIRKIVSERICLLRDGSRPIQVPGQAGVSLSLWPSWGREHERSQGRHTTLGATQILVARSFNLSFCTGAAHHEDCLHAHSIPRRCLHDSWWRRLEAFWFWLTKWFWTNSKNLLTDAGVSCCRTFFVSRYCLRLLLSPKGLAEIDTREIISVLCVDDVVMVRVRQDDAVQTRGTYTEVRVMRH